MEAALEIPLAVISGSAFLSSVAATVASLSRKRPSSLVVCLVPILFLGFVAVLIWQPLLWVFDARLADWRGTLLLVLCSLALAVAYFVVPAWVAARERRGGSSPWRWAVRTVVFGVLCLASLAAQQRARLRHGETLRYEASLWLRAAQPPKRRVGNAAPLYEQVLTQEPLDNVYAFDLTTVMPDDLLPCWGDCTQVLAQFGDQDPAVLFQDQLEGLEHLEFALLALAEISELSYCRWEPVPKPSQQAGDDQPNRTALLARALWAFVQMAGHQALVGDREAAQEWLLAATRFTRHTMLLPGEGARRIEDAYQRLLPIYGWLISLNAMGPNELMEAVEDLPGEAEMALALRRDAAARLSEDLRLLSHYLAHARTSFQLSLWAISDEPWTEAVLRRQYWWRVGHAPPLDGDHYLSRLVPSRLSDQLLPTDTRAFAERVEEIAAHRAQLKAAVALHAFRLAHHRDPRSRDELAQWVSQQPSALSMPDDISLLFRGRCIILAWKSRQERKWQYHLRRFETVRRYWELGWLEAGRESDESP